MERLLAPDIPKWIIDMLPNTIMRHRVDVGGLNMHVMECGQGMPVLMLHGNPTWGFLYRNIASHLVDKRFRLIMPDLIGLGFSDRPESAEIHTLDQHIQWIGRMLDQLNIKKLIFVGQDWGGPIGLGALSHRPEVIKGMVILNTVIGPPKPGFKPTFFHRFSRLPIISFLAFRLFGFPQNMLSRVQGNKRSIRGPVAWAYQYPLKGIFNNAAPLALARMVPNSMDHPSVAALQKCKDLVDNYQGPANIVWGRKDPILGKVLKRIQTSLPQAKVQVTDAGHFIQEEEPKLIADAICDVHERIKKR